MHFGKTPGRSPSPAVKRGGSNSRNSDSRQQRCVTSNGSPSSFTTKRPDSAASMNSEKAAAAKSSSYLPLTYSRNASSGITMSKSALDSHESAYPKDTPGGKIGPGAHNPQASGQVHSMSYWLGGGDRLTMTAATQMSSLSRREKRLLCDTEEEYHALIRGAQVSPEARQMARQMGFHSEEAFLFEELSVEDKETLERDRAFVRGVAKFIGVGKRSMYK